MTDISSISLFNDLIYTLDRESMEIHIFNDNLIYQKKLSIPFFAQSMTVLSNDLIALYVGNEITDNTGRLVIYNIDSNSIIYDHLSISANQKRYFNFLTSYNFFKLNNVNYFWNSPQNEIFQIGEEGQISNGFYLDYGNKGVPEGFYEQAKYENPYEFVQDARSKGYSHCHFMILANDNFVLIHFDKADTFGTTLFNIESRKSKTTTKVIDDIWINKEMEDIILSFFTDLYGKNNFVSFMPFEYLEESNDSGLSKGEDYLVFGKLRSTSNN